MHQQEPEYLPKNVDGIFQADVTVAIDMDVFQVDVRVTVQENDIFQVDVRVTVHGTFQVDVTITVYENDIFQVDVRVTVHVNSMFQADVTVNPACSSCIF